jgi:hypothetical protein
VNLVTWQLISIALILVVGLPLAIISAKSSLHEKKEAQKHRADKPTV